MIKQVVILVDHRDVLQPVGIAVKLGGGLAVQCDRTAGGNVQPSQQREEGGLSAAGHADHSIDLPGSKTQLTPLTAWTSCNFVRYS